jgi:carbon-monoxide dehydrogenase large subunit
MSRTESADAATEDVSEQDRSNEWVGTGVPRKEDRDILTGRREYTHDRNPPDALHAAYVRSPHAHARIVDIDTSAAEEHPECAAVITNETYREWGYNPMICGLREWEEWPLAEGKVTYVGQCVALVLAENRYVAEDLLDLVSVEYEVLDPVVDAMDARESDTVVHPNQGPEERRNSNVAHGERLSFGDVDEAFEEADHVVEGEFAWSGRASGVPLETPGALAEYNPSEADGEATFHIWSNQQLHTHADVAIYAALDLPREEVRVEVPLTSGGSYGTKQQTVYRHCILTAVAAEMTGRPVKYVEDRIEDLQGGDGAATDRHHECRLAMTDDGEILAVDFWFADNFGAFPRFICTNQVLKPVSVLTGPYDIDHAAYEYEIVTTNKMPQSAYRGFGAQAHNYVLEMLVDKAAKAVGMDPTELRRRNLIPEEEMPSERPSKNVYGEGDYPGTLAKVWETALEAERTDGGLLDPEVIEERREEGKYRGAAPSLMLEPGVPAKEYENRLFTPKEKLEAFYDPDNPDRTLDQVHQLPEPIEVDIRTDGTVEAIISSDSAGQGHQTIVSQALAEELGCDPSDVAVPGQDNLDVASTLGSAASRMAVMLSSAAMGVGEKLREQLETLAARTWNCDPSRVEYSIEDAGVRCLGGEHEGELLTLEELSRAERLGHAGEPVQPPRSDRLTHATHLQPEVAVDNVEFFEEGLLNMYPLWTTISFAANVPIVEVDVETGEVELLKLYTVRDAGRIVNPTILDGQYHGGIAQGIGAALKEEFAYDEEGQPQSVTLFDMTLPSVKDVPDLEIEHQETWSIFTRSGVKGAGETGIIDMPASIAVSINDALEPFDIVVPELPATPDRLHGWIRDAIDE